MFDAKPLTIKSSVVMFHEIIYTIVRLHVAAVVTTKIISAFCLLSKMLNG